MTQESICPNCSYPLDNEAIYCPNCGQKQQKGIPTVRELVNDFFSLVLNLDAKIIRTLKRSLLPGQLTKDYFAGIRHRYYPPFRFFFVSAVLFFWLLSTTSFSLEMGFGKTNNPLSVLKGKTKKYLLIKEIQQALDEAQIRDPKTYAVLDTFLFRNNTNALSDSSTMEVNLLSGKTFYFKTADLLGLNSAELIEKYHIKNYWDRIMVTQAYKLSDNPAGFSKQVIGHFIWMIILLIPAFALFLKLLYYRKKKYYLEHLVLLLHNHAFAFLCFSIALAIVTFINEADFVFILAGVLSIVYVFLSMKWYYHDSWIKTALKFLSGIILYYVLGLLFLVGLFSVSFMLY